MRGLPPADHRRLSAPPAHRGNLKERAADEEDWGRADTCYSQICSALTMTFPDGGPVAEFMLHIHDDGTAGWRWHDEPFDTVNQ